MVTVLIAGGLGDVGRTITEAIYRTGKHKVYVSTRKIPVKTDVSRFANLVAVDYTSTENLTRHLQEWEVDVVISALNLELPGAATAQKNLIRASGESGCVKGFIPSEFNIDYSVPEPKMPYPTRVEFLTAVEELKSWPQLHFTLVRCGFFLDYLGLPYAETHLRQLYCLLDLPHRRAVIPGDGTAIITFTHSRDMAKLTAALIDTPPQEWSRECTVVGEKITLNGLVDLAQKVAGHPFDISYEPVDTLRSYHTTELPSNKSCYQGFPEGKKDLDIIISTMMIGMAEGVFDIQGTSLNHMFPDIDMTGIERFLNDCLQWAGNEV